MSKDYPFVNSLDRAEGIQVFRHHPNFGEEVQINMGTRTGPNITLSECSEGYLSINEATDPKMVSKDEAVAYVAKVIQTVAKNNTLFREALALYKGEAG